MKQALLSKNPAATRALASRLAARLKGGEVLCLFGPLGAGKTTFVQGLARALGANAAATSPSFMLVREYRTRRRRPRTIYHMDFYRVAAEEIPNLGLEDYLSDPDGVCVIEWAEAALTRLPGDRLELLFGYPRAGKEPGTERRVEMKAHGPTSSALLKTARQQSII